MTRPGSGGGRRQCPPCHRVGAALDAFVAREAAGAKQTAGANRHLNEKAAAVQDALFGLFASSSDLAELQERVSAALAAFSLR